MPNRIIKESITTDERFGQVSLFAELLYYHLLVVCDDYGRADARLPQLRARLFPWRLQRISEAMIDQALDELARVGLLVRYVVRGVPYLAILNWEGNQQRRARSPKYPAPEEALEALPDGAKAPESAQQAPSVPAKSSASLGEASVPPAMDLSWLPTDELDDSWLFGEPSNPKASPEVSSPLSLFEEQPEQQRGQPKERSASAEEPRFHQEAADAQLAPGQEAPLLREPSREESSGDSSAAQAPKPQKRKEDPLFVALLEAIYQRPYQEISLTASERGRCNKAVAQLRAIGASPEEIHRRAAFYRLHFPHAALTPTALVANWNHCAGPPPPRSSPAQIRAREALQRAIDAVAAARVQDQAEEVDAIDLNDEWGDAFERKGLPS